MRSIAMRSGLGRPGLVLGILLLAALITLGVLALWPRSARLTLLVNGQPVATGGSAAQLQEALAAWARAELARTLTLEHEGEEWAYTLAELGLVHDLAAARAELPALGERPRRSRAAAVTVESDWDPVRLQAVVAQLAPRVERSPVSASLQVEGERVTIAPSHPGVALPVERLAAALRALGETSRLMLPVEPVEPAVSAAALEAMAVRRLIATWSTHYDPTVPRAENVERAARSFDGLLLKPGEILSYNGTVGPINESTGWREAMVIVAGQLVPGVGGGVCQVATTLYGAALRANMEVLERHPHQLSVGYIPPAEDAAVAQGWQDLKLRNSGAGHLLIRSTAEGGTVTFWIYGDQPEDLTVRIESRVTGSQPFATRTVVDPSLPPGQEVLVQQGAPGLSAEAYRLVYRAGELIRRELLSRDLYLPTTQVVRTGPGAPADGGN